MRQIEKTSNLTVDSYRIYLSQVSLLSEDGKNSLFSGEPNEYSISLIIDRLKTNARQVQLDYCKNLWVNATDENLQNHYKSMWQELVKTTTIS